MQNKKKTEAERLCYVKVFICEKRSCVKRDLFVRTVCFDSFK